jgi:uncharacterized protein DUF4864
MAGRKRRAFLALTAVLALAFATLAASAQSVSSTDARAIREVIEAQLDAFRRDDSTRAFSYAAPGIRASFGTAENFMAMVREQYAVVYRPHSVSFEEPALIDGEPIQPVRMTDAEGRAWLALYPMEKQRDGSWKINGCQLARLTARET